MRKQTIAVAGATGKLGGRIVGALRARGAHVVALIRASSSAEKVTRLRALGAETATVDLTRVDTVTRACTGASCVVSALLGVRDTMVDAQTVLLEGSVAAGVPRFIPSDYSLDFTKLKRGENRNLDWHAEFQTRLDRASIAATSILNGAYMELLVGPAPLILFKLRRVLYWGSADQPLDFTAMDDVAAFTAAAALDAQTPRFLKIVGERITARRLAEVTGEVIGRKFKPTWAGSLASLAMMIKVMRLLRPAPDDPFPAWQGMQYTHNMFAGRALLEPLDNARYPDVQWTSVRELLSRSMLAREAAPASSALRLLLRRARPFSR